MAAATLAVSLVMSGLTFWAVNNIQSDARLNDTRFGQDLGLLMAANVAPLIAEDNRTEIARLSQKFYNSTTSIRYMLYADPDGEIYYGIPFSESEVKNSLTIRRRIQLPEGKHPTSDHPLVRQHLTPDGEVTDVFVGLYHEKQELGILALGINPNPTVVTSSNLTRDVTIAVFVSIWVMVILGAVFNALQITQPIKELVAGVKNIAAGNFKQRVDLPFGGELGELISSFNEMAERLERYEEQNVEEMTAQKAKLETLVSTIADGAVLLDAELRVVLINPAALRIFNWETNPPMGGNVLQSLPDKLRAELTRPLAQMVNGEREGGEFRVVLQEASDRSDRTVRVLLNTVFDQRRESLKGITMTVQDISREVELNDAKSQFISNVSHELRTPLFNIKSFIETLQEYGPELSEVERLEFLDTANRETDRLTRLVNDVLDLSRLESGRQYQLDAVYIAQPVEQTLRTYQLNARDKGIELISEIEPDLPPVWGNYDLLLQVFANLVGNAVKFTPAGGKVKIHAYCFHQPVCNLKEAEGALPAEIEASAEEHSWPVHVRPGVVRIEVSDTGIGIAPEDQTRIFERFFRVENRVHTLEGTGLGLSIVHNIIEKHHSKIHISSEVGSGTTFWFDLSVFQEQSTVALPELVLPELEPVSEFLA
ncbi:HAMP domain-containing protein [Leptolyngbya sp. FACHB-261]|nr:HAMP domain-containing protein [Leptolyngbya sp. FACHB-261]